MDRSAGAVPRAATRWPERAGGRGIAAIALLADPVLIQQLDTSLLD